VLACFADTHTDKQDMESQMNQEVANAREAIGLPPDPYTLPKFDHRWNVVAKCPHCGTLFGSFSADEADLQRIVTEDCGRFWQHRS